MGGPVLVPGSEGAGGRPGVDTHAFRPIIDPHQAFVPTGADFFAYQPVGHRVESSGHFHMPVGMYDAGAYFKEAETLFRQGFKRRFLHF